jgi:hypothetical protein
MDGVRLLPTFLLAGEHKKEINMTKHQVEAEILLLVAIA